MKTAVVKIVVVLWLFSCSDPVDTRQGCFKGKCVGDYCEGTVIQLLDNKAIGKSWKSMFSDYVYQNSVIASFDTTIFKNTVNPAGVLKDSVIYFQYRMGGYARKQYNICEPSAFITITGISASSCTD